MQEFSSTAPTQAQYRHDRDAVVGMCALVIGMTVCAWWIGKSDRVTYAGPDRTFFEPDLVHLNVDPPGNYVMPRGPAFDAMKAGCRSDLAYAPQFGIGPRGNRVKTVRSATLVDCP